MSRLKAALIVALLPLFAATLTAQSFEELAGRLRETDPAAPGSGDLLLETLRRAPDVPTAREYYSRYAELLTNPRQEAEGYRWLGSLEELLGNFQGALVAFEALLEIEPAAEDVRLRAAAAALETGDYERARAHALYVIDSARDRSMQREAGLLLALSHFYQDRREEGLPLFRSLTRGSSRSTVEPRTLLYALLAARAWEAEGFATELEEKLETLYPGTVDALAGGGGEGRVSLAPRPTLLLPQGTFADIGERRAPETRGAQTAATVPETAEEEEIDEPPRDQRGRSRSEADPSPREPLVIGIQTGSFSDRENAVIMRDEIREAGIAAEVRSVEIDGRVFYRVVVPTEEPTRAEGAQNLVVRLKELGVEGFLLFAE